MDRTTAAGALFLALGLAASLAGDLIVQSTPVAAAGLAMCIIGAFAILVVPEPVHRDAFGALLSDSVQNIEAILKERNAQEKAYYFLNGDGLVRAFVPTPSPKAGGAAKLSSADLLAAGRGPLGAATGVGTPGGVLVVPPGALLVSLAKVQKGADLEEAFRSVLVESSGLCSSVIALGEQGSRTAKIEVRSPSISLDSPYFNRCFGSLVGSVAAGVAAAASERPVRILEESQDGRSVRISLELI